MLILLSLTPLRKPRFGLEFLQPFDVLLRSVGDRHAKRRKLSLWAVV